MQPFRFSWIVVVCVHMAVAAAAGQALDKNAQRIVNDAAKDLKSKDAEKRVLAVDHLATWGKLTAAPLVIGALKDPDARVRAAAADALWNSDMKTDAARAPLTAALGDPAPEVAVLAAGALRLLGASKADVQKANERGLGSTSPRIRFLAARGLIGVVPPAPLVDPLVAYLEIQSVADASLNISVAEQALEELRNTKDSAIVAPLVAAVDRMEKGAHTVLKVLGGVQPRPAGWTSLLIAQAARSDANVRRMSLLLMRDVKADADVAQWSPVAARLLSTDADDVVRSYAASALEFGAGGAHAQADAVLTAARRDRSASVRAAAFEALEAVIGRAGTAPMNVKTTMAKAALPVIQAAIDTDPDEDVRENAIDALDALALDPAQAASLLVALGARASLPVALRTLAISKLRNRGAEARSVAADLQRLKGDANAAVREKAAEALERVTTDRSTPTAAVVTPPAAVSNPGTRPAAAAPTAADEARGLSVIRARKVEFAADQFYKALGDNDLDLARAFLDAGMSAKNPFPFGNKETPLTAAVSQSACSPAVRPTAASTLELVQLLIARGADAAIADEHGNTPLMQAAQGGCDAIVMAALLKAGGRVNATNQAGLSAFESGLFAAHDGLDALLAAGYRLPLDKVKMYLEAYKANAKAVALIKRATPSR